MPDEREPGHRPPPPPAPPPQPPPPPPSPSWAAAPPGPSAGPVPTPDLAATGQPWGGGPAGWQGDPVDDATFEQLGGRLLPLRPMSVSDILDGAFRGLRATFLPSALVVIALIGPLQLALNFALFQVAPTTSGFSFDLDTVDEAVVLDEILASFGVTFVGSIVGLVITLVVSVAVIALILRVDRGEEPSARDAVVGAGRPLLVTFGASVLVLLAGLLVFAAWAVLIVLSFTIPLLTMLLVLLSIPMFVIFGSAYFGYLNLLVPVAMVERRGVLTTMGRAWWVLRVKFWRVVGLSLLVGLLVAVVSGVVQVPFLIGSSYAGDFAWLVQSVGEMLGQVIAIPVTMFAVLLIYLDARVRLEGLDLQLRVRSFGSS